MGHTNKHGESALLASFRRSYNQGSCPMSAPEDLAMTVKSAPDVRLIRKLMVANRSEIATRVFRSSHELGVRTVAVYSHEDRFALHRFKADEAYRVGKAGEPLR